MANTSGTSDSGSTATQRPKGFRRVLSIPKPPMPAPRPAASREEAMERLAGLQALDHDGISPETRTRLFEPDHDTDTTIVIWHGFTNAPTQFVEISERLRQAGHRVLLPRMPRHGIADLLNRELAHLTAEELVEHTDTCIDIAAGLGKRVWVVGLSAGAVLAAWAALSRPQVERVVLAAPLVAPKGFPMPLVRFFVRFRRMVPPMYMWWDPRKKADIGESPHAYPGFPVRGIMPFLHLSESMFDRVLKPNHTLRRVVLLSNPGDFAIRRDAAREFVWHVFDQHSDYLAEATVNADLGWWHDFVDPWSHHGGTTDEVAPIFFTTLGIGEDATAAGKLVEPLVTLDPDAPPAG